MRSTSPSSSSEASCSTNSHTQERQLLPRSHCVLLSHLYLFIYLTILRLPVTNPTHRHRRRRMLCECSKCWVNGSGTIVSYSTMRRHRLHRREVTRHSNQNMERSRSHSPRNKPRKERIIRQRADQSRSRSRSPTDANLKYHKVTPISLIDEELECVETKPESELQSHSLTDRTAFPSH